MPENKLYPPEGLRPPASFTLQGLREALEQGTVLESIVQRCDLHHDLHLSLGGIPARIPPGGGPLPLAQRGGAGYLHPLPGGKARLLLCDGHPGR